MIAHFFLKRPVFATVLSIIITLIGLVAMRESPVEQYPQILPTDVVVSTNYPAASADVIASTVASPIEQEINGVENMLYMKSASSNSGTLDITVTFDVKADPAQAEIDVNNRVQSAMPLLPAEVKSQGISVRRQSSSILQVVTLTSDNPTYDQLFVSNYALINVIDALKRIDGVGEASLFAPMDYSMRIWLKPDKLKSHNLTVNDVITAIKEQNSQFAVGKFAEEPLRNKNDLTFNIKTDGRFTSVEQFEKIILRTKSRDSAALTLKDVAKVTLGSRSYSFSSKYNNSDTAAIVIYLQTGANALATAKAIKTELADCQPAFPRELNMPCRLIQQTL